MSCVWGFAREDPGVLSATDRQRPSRRGRGIDPEGARGWDDALLRRGKPEEVALLWLLTRMGRARAFCPSSRVWIKIKEEDICVSGVPGLTLSDQLTGYRGD